MRTPPVLMLLIVAPLGLVVAGCGSGGDSAGPPQVTDASVTPRELQFAGGAVTIQATVQADAQVQQVSATVTGPAGAQTVSLATSGDQFEGTFTAPANGATAVASYSVSVTATDTGNRVSAAYEAGTFTVQPAAPPPAAPPGW